MYFETARQILKPHLREYVESITRKSKGGLYCCPLCKSGTKKKGTGAFSIDRTGTRWICFACGNGKSGDIFDLIGQVEGIENRLEQLRRACDIFGLDLNAPEPGQIKRTAQRVPSMWSYQDGQDKSKSGPTDNLSATRDGLTAGKGAACRDITGVDAATSPATRDGLTGDDDYLQQMQQAAARAARSGEW